MLHRKSSRLRVSRLAILAGAVCIITIVFAFKFRGRTNDANDSQFELRADGTAILTAVVLKNDRGCRVDGVCTLRINLSDGEAFVIYHQGESDVCVNERASREGFALVPGERVVVHGAYKEIGGRRYITTCPSPTFYIHPLR